MTIDSLFLVVIRVPSFVNSILIFEFRYSYILSSYSLERFLIIHHSYPYLLDIHLPLLFPRQPVPRLATSPSPSPSSDRPWHPGLGGRCAVLFSGGRCSLQRAAPARLGRAADRYRPGWMLPPLRRQWDSPEAAPRPVDVHGRCEM